MRLAGGNGGGGGGVTLACVRCFRTRFGGVTALIAAAGVIAAVLAAIGIEKDVGDFRVHGARIFGIRVARLRDIHA